MLAVCSQVFRNGQPKDARTATHIKDAGWLGKGFLQGQFHQFFGFRAGNEGSGIGLKFVVTEVDSSVKVLEWNVLPPFFELVAERYELIFFQRLIKAEVKIHPLEAQFMGDHELHIEPGIPNAFLLEKRSSFLKNIENRRHVSEM